MGDNIKKGSRMRTGFIWLETKPVAGTCETGGTPSGFLKGGEFFDHLSDYKLLKNDLRFWR
jgi:hypothetical protein